MERRWSNPPEGSSLPRPLAWGFAWDLKYGLGMPPLARIQLARTRADI
jgi:hypothetical protein